MFEPGEFPMSRSAEYRRKAAACLLLAEQTSDEEAKLRMLDTAQSWRFLANQADRNSHNDVVYETPTPQQIQPDKKSGD
jgi:hypothetical protein